MLNTIDDFLEGLDLGHQGLLGVFLEAYLLREVAYLFLESLEVLLGLGLFHVVALVFFVGSFEVLDGQF